MSKNKAAIEALLMGAMLEGGAMDEELQKAIQELKDEGLFDDLKKGPAGPVKTPLTKKQKTARAKSKRARKARRLNR